MKVNITSLIIYIVAVICLILLGLIFEQPALLLFIFAFIFLIPLSVILFNNIYSKYSFSLYSKTEYTEEPNSPRFFLEYNRDFPIGLFTADIELSVENRFFPNEMTHKLSIPIARKKNSFIIPVEVEEIGLISVTVKKITIYDYLSLFKRTSEEKLELSVPVLPKDRAIGDFPPAVPKDGPDEYTESDSTGNISSDVKEIREYRPGDRLQRIHWKLSAKLDDLFVKEMSHTSTLAIVLLPELNRKDIHDTSETLKTCIKKMIEQKERFELCIYNNTACDFTTFIPTNDDGLIEAMTHFYCQPLYDGKENALNAFVNSSDRIATVIHICGKNIRIGD